MADSTLNRFVGEGDDAQEAAFTPDPPTPASGPDSACLFVNKEDPMNPELKWWDGSAFLPLGGGGSGDVSATGTLTANNLIIGAGSTDVSPLGSLGTTTTVLHGNAGGAPTFGAVVEADITLADNTTNNAATTKHGFLKKLPNDATQYMDGTGNWSVPAGSGGGGLTLVEDHTASNSASLDFTTGITSTYDDYVIKLDYILPATDGVDFYMLVSTDGGSTWASTTYAIALSYIGTPGGGGTGFHILSAQSQFRIADSIENTAANGGVSGTIDLIAPLNASSHKHFRAQYGHAHSNGFYYDDQGSFWWLTTTAVNAVRFIMSSGNIASGTIRLYGYEK